MEIAKTKDDLPPDTDLECPICMNKIDIDEIKGGVPNCLICENGHRMHRDCPSNPSSGFNHINECPVCRNKNMKNCKSRNGYSYVERKGGKKRKTNKRKTNKRKTSKSKRRKSRNKR
jgi:hypothetical protein